MICGECIFWEPATKECSNRNVRGDDALVYPEAEEMGYFEITVKFESNFGCIFFFVHPERGKK